jgi:hypothetical protein
VGVLESLVFCQHLGLTCEALRTTSGAMAKPKTPPKRKHRAAAALGARGGKSRWAGVSKAARTRAMRALALRRHGRPKQGAHP